MLRLLILVTVLSVANSQDVSNVAGVWQVIRVYAPEITSDADIDQTCDYVVNITVINGRQAECVGKKVPIANVDLYSTEGEGPVIPITSDSEARRARLNECDIEFPGKVALRHYSDTYTTLHYYQESFDRMAMVLSRTIPSDGELQTFLQTVEEFKDKFGTTVCTKELQKSSTSTTEAN